LVLFENEICFDAHTELKKGDIAKICGKSGAGKSTFAKALLYRPIEGVFINKVPINKIYNTELRKRVEFVPQNIPIIRGSLRDMSLSSYDWTSRHHAVITFL
jgi:ABC-type bacteriocin/lantibiotic exporter with double-glycine peptidase domain